MTTKPRAPAVKSWGRSVFDVSSDTHRPSPCPKTLPASNPQTILEDPRPQSQNRDAIPIHHLLNAPDGDDLAPRFPIRDTPPGQVGEEDETTLNGNEADDSSEASHWSEGYEQNDVFVGAPMPEFEGVNFDSFFGGFESLTFGSYPLNNDLPQMLGAAGPISASAMALEPRAYEIRQLLLGAIDRLAMEYPDHPQLPMLSTHIELFTHVEIDHCLGLFFSNYYRHCPILHRPSFQPTLIPESLLLTCVALGGMYSDPAKVAWMKSLLDVIETFIFSLPSVKDEYFSPMGSLQVQDAEALNYHFQTFQGAYLCVVVQYFSGNPEARRRARRNRFSTILSVSYPFSTRDCC